MTSKTSLTELIETVLIAHEYNDVTGTVSVNVTEALFAIATAINRLAAVQEREEERRAEARLIVEALQAQAMRSVHPADTDDGPGHA